MRRILVTGALGQIGSELTVRLRELYGEGSVVASSKSAKDGHQELVESGPFEIVDVTNREQLADVVKKHKIKPSSTWQPSCLPWRTEPHLA